MYYFFSCLNNVKAPERIHQFCQKCHFEDHKWNPLQLSAKYTGTIGQFIQSNIQNKLMSKIMKGSGVREGSVFCQAPIAWL